MMNQRIAVLVYNKDHSEMLEKVFYSSRVLTERDFKKWYNHIYRRFVNKGTADVADVFAEYEDEVGDTCELAQYWGNEEMRHNPHIPFC